MCAAFDSVLRSIPPRPTAAPQETSAVPGAPALANTPAARILEELDDVVRISHRPPALRRMLHMMGGALTRLWSRMAPEPLLQRSDLAPNLVPLVLPVAGSAEDIACRQSGDALGRA